MLNESCCTNGAFCMDNVWRLSDKIFVFETMVWYNECKRGQKMKDTIRDTVKEVEEAVEELEQETGSAKITFRTNRELKKKAEQVFGAMGLTMSGAINVFLAQCVREQRLPFQPGATSEEIEENDFDAMLDNADMVLGNAGILKRRPKYDDFRE